MEEEGRRVEQLRKWKKRKWEKEEETRARLYRVFIERCGLEHKDAVASFLILSASLTLSFCCHNAGWEAKTRSRLLMILPTSCDLTPFFFTKENYD